MLRRLSVSYLFLVTALFKLKQRWLIKAASWLLWRSYVPSTRGGFRRAVGDIATAIFILPGAAAGALVRLAMWATGTKPSPMLAQLLAAKPPETKDAEIGSGAGAGAGE